MAAIIPQTCRGCDHCNGTGECLCEDLDREGLWFRNTVCGECTGTGIATCAADGCERLATRTVRIGGHAVQCCDDLACTASAFTTALGRAK